MVDLGCGMLSYNFPPSSISTFTSEGILLGSNSLVQQNNCALSAQDVCYDTVLYNMIGSTHFETIDIKWTGQRYLKKTFPSKLSSSLAFVFAAHPRKSTKWWQGVACLESAETWCIVRHTSPQRGETARSPQPRTSDNDC